MRCLWLAQAGRWNRSLGTFGRCNFWRALAGWVEKESLVLLDVTVVKG